MPGIFLLHLHSEQASVFMCNLLIALILMQRMSFAPITFRQSLTLN